VADKALLLRPVAWQSFGRHDARLERAAPEDRAVTLQDWLKACAFVACLAFAPNAYAHGAFAIGGSTADTDYGFAAGYTWDQPTKQQAEAKAIERCKAYPSEAPEHTNAKCAVVQTYSHAWLVIAMDPDRGQTGFGYSVNVDKETAERNAMALCKSSSPNARKSFCAIAAEQHDEKP
jgi:Domain of unknown function (DUF4189)